MLKIDSQTQTLWCYCIGSVTVVKREREGGRSTSGSGRQLVNEVGVGHRDARPLGQRGGGVGSLLWTNGPAICPPALGI